MREAISQVVGDAKEKNRKFMETNELQIGLKNYNPQMDKCFSGSVKLPHIARPKMKGCMLGDAQHVEEVNYTPNFSSKALFVLPNHFNLMQINKSLELDNSHDLPMNRI